MISLLISTAILWLLTGAVLIVFEVMVAPGIGLLFAGLAAITVGGLITVGLVNESKLTLQFILFFVFSAVWASVLWKPMKAWRYKTSSKQYNHMIGESAIVKNMPLTKHQFGQVAWSGTILKARIADAAAIDSIPAETEVKIVQVEGNNVFVIPRDTTL